MIFNIKKSNLFYKRILLFCLLGAFSALGSTYPKRPDGPVGDYAGILDHNTVSSVSRISQALWEQAGFALIIATVPSIGDLTIEEYATSLYEKWGIGSKDTDEGVLILLSLNPRRVRIEVGYGAEGYLNDAKTGRFLDNYGVPRFRNGEYSAGILALAVEIAKTVESEKQISLKLPIQSYRSEYSEESNEISPFSIILFIIIFIVMISTRFGRSLLLFLLINSLLGGRRGGYGSGGGGGFGGGFSGGFGGGFSGGGGSSRSF